MIDFRVDPIDLGTFFIECEGNCVEVEGQALCSAGDYVVDTYDANGCRTDGLVTIEEIGEDDIELGTFTVCPGECVAINGQSFCTTGNFSVDTTLTNGCEVLAHFTIEVLNVIDYDLGMIELCAGECFDYQGESYCTEGMYALDTIDMNGCNNFVLFEIVFIDALALAIGPLSKICDATNTAYTVSFYITSGVPPFYVDGMLVTDSLYVSALIPSDSSFQFELSDSEACNPPLTIDGVHECLIPACQTDAGSMSAVLQSGCGAESITATANADAIVETDDAVVYILHTSAAAQLGTILAMNSAPQFSFDAQLMEYGRTYYISRVVGNELNGEVDLADACLSVAPGQPIIFYEAPEVNIGEDQYFLPGEVVELSYQTTSTINEVQWVINGEVVSTDTRFQFSPQQESNVSVTIIDENGCAARDQLVIAPCDPEDFLYIPNVFTPNADGTNDRFTVLGSEKVMAINRFSIFSRWGNMVFERQGFTPNDQNYGWDGHVKGKMAPSDTYIYLVEATLINGESVLMKGDVTLIR